MSLSDCSDRAKVNQKFVLLTIKHLFLEWSLVYVCPPERGAEGILQFFIHKNVSDLLSDNEKHNEKHKITPSMVAFLLPSTGNES